MFCPSWLHREVPRRRPFARAINANLTVIKQALGYRSIASTAIYTVPTDETAGKALAAALSSMFSPSQIPSQFFLHPTGYFENRRAIPHAMMPTIIHSREHVSTSKPLNIHRVHKDGAIPP
jgi:hypothetical protein